MNRFILDGRYGDLLKCYGISVAEALRKAGLPGDVFSHKTPAMKEEEYFKFMEAVGSLVTDPETPIHIACTDKIELRHGREQVSAGIKNKHRNKKDKYFLWRKSNDL